MRIRLRLRKRSVAVWCGMIALCGLTVLAQQRLREYQTPEWVTIDAPNPPPPLPYPTDATPVQEE